MPDCSFDGVLSDPPYALTGKSGKGGFMGKDWDKALPPVAVWQEVFRVCKPGAYILIFGGTRTFHRLACNIEDSGFEIKDTLNWLYGSGMPKGFNFHRLDLCNCNSNQNFIEYNQEVNYENRSSMPNMPETFSERTMPYQENQTTLLQQSLCGKGKSKESNSVFQQYEGEKTKPEGLEQGKESMLEGREIHNEKRLCNDKKPKPPKSKSKRLCKGTYPSNGTNVGETIIAEGRNTSQKSNTQRQPPREPSIICNSQRTLDEGTLQNHSCCPNCGKLIRGYKGYSSGLKPAWEPIILAQKPIEGTYAANVLKWGCGGLNIDQCRIESESITTTNGKQNKIYGDLSANGGTSWSSNAKGRYPANLLLTHHPDCEYIGEKKIKEGKPNGQPNTDESATNVYGWKEGGIHKSGVHYGEEIIQQFNCVEGCPIKQLDQQSGKRSKGHFPKTQNTKSKFMASKGKQLAPEQYTDEGGASRFFKTFHYTPETNELGPTRFYYNSKASPTERKGNNHPTIKPLAVCRYLATLIKPPTGKLLVPYSGSGSEMVAALQSGWQSVTGIEREEAYIKIAGERLNKI